MINKEKAAKTTNENISIPRLIVGRADSDCANGLVSLALLDMAVHRDTIAIKRENSTKTLFEL